MASRHARKNRPAAHASGSEDENSRQSSQEADMNVLEAARNIVSTIKNRRESKRKVIEAEFKKCVADINSRLDARFESRKNRVTKLQQVQWDRLEALNKKRQNIENLILSSMKIIEVHTMNLSSELDAMFSGRIEEIEDGPAQEE